MITICNALCKSGSRYRFSHHYRHLRLTTFKNLGGVWLLFVWLLETGINGKWFGFFPISHFFFCFFFSFHFVCKEKSRPQCRRFELFTKQKYLHGRLEVRSFFFLFFLFFYFLQLAKWNNDEVLSNLKANIWIYIIGMRCMECNGKQSRFNLILHFENFVNVRTPEERFLRLPANVRRLHLDWYCFPLKCHECYVCKVKPNKTQQNKMSVCYSAVRHCKRREVIITKIISTTIIRNTENTEEEKKQEQQQRKNEKNEIYIKGWEWKA